MSKKNIVLFLEKNVHKALKKTMQKQSVFLLFLEQRRVDKKCVRKVMKDLLFLD